MNLKQNENTEEKRRRTTLLYTKEKTISYSSLNPHLRSSAGLYIDKGIL